MPITLRQARRIADLTQKQMADILGMAINTYRKLEEDPSKATIEQAKKVSVATGFPVEQIFLGK